ncbi:UNVERIFIED_CONTAM: hypothetical protein KWE62_18735 [Acinetobacter baumannii]|uniref:hypothetical protein n=1 Tax=Acinetobacter TaxID=469 RepID=UPI0008DEA54B|nr:hypothetical protein [Acinetobacter baumannii]EHU1620052.1 hypothetical protein [Acinetobacter baumannii]MCT9502763.1 hypothetical protein [Acinetobacter baumannii]MCZ3030142.1 hypothetical protein [Acinetobacter baumannii]MDA5047474.1 hypothetical protein [Acinetobacter baumannii]MDC4517068.1 hypothetical protein [Acinetobacter baumannii]
METLLLSLSQNSDKISSLMTALTILMSLLALSSLLTTKKMYKARREAEITYIKSLLESKEFIERIKNSEQTKFLVEIHPKHNLVVLNGEELFINVFKNLDQKSQKQIEPALFQKNLKNRKAYLEKVVSEAKKIMNMIESHC